IAAIHDDKVLLLNSGIEDCENLQCIYRKSNHIDVSEYHNSIFDNVVRDNKIFISNNYPEYFKSSQKSHTDEEILNGGIKSIVIRPLHLDNKIIGIFLIKSKNQCEFDPLNLMKLEEIYPLFSLVIERALEDFDNEVESLVQKNFTSIHPAIEWKFRKAAMSLIDRNKNGLENEMEKIIFEDVYPLYCATDIRGSSTQRNHAIQSDLAEHLTIVKDIIESANSIKNLPILDEFIYRINKYIDDLSDGLVTGDELEIINFLRKEIEVSFSDLKLFGDEIKNKIEKYNNILDPEIGTLYSKRRDFDESVDLINKTISNYLDKMQIEAQKMFPHYFDKNTTDGVDQNIYIGASLTDKVKFDKLYLKNLRLWQLIVLSNIARLTDKLIEKLKIPLETTHLIVVQDMPLTLVFKTDEKKLAVEGAYNIRYEIMKKRIDKAVVKESGERLTQIGKIAIVYTQNSEANEYRQYIEFLTAKGYLDGNIEDLLLEDLQGIKGLKALRVGINLKSESDYYSFSEFI
ncbi:MAG TPA: GAF domain-containing protein, partial [Spirochaetota bacterium]|nr:GAF domain-containing protein [Spirochaetota bacterium]